MLKWVKDHGLSITFVLLFLAAITGQTIAGHDDFNSQLTSHGMHAIGFFSYLATGNFLNGILVNWQAAVLQLGSLIVFGTGMKEKGAAHSRKPDDEPEGKKKKEQEQKKARTRKQRSWLYRHSLSIAFGLLFVGTFTAHLFFGAKDYNERQTMNHQPTMSTADYAVGSDFWFQNAQTWEAEFAVIAIYIVSSIYLRQEGSPESKPVESSDKETGETNE